MRPGQGLPQLTRSVGVRLLLVVLGGTAGVVVARALQPEGRGAYAIVVAVATATMAVGHLSLEQAYVGLWPAREAAVTAGSVVLAPVLGTAAALGAAGLAAAGVFGAAATAAPAVLACGLLAVPAMMTVLHLNTVLMLTGQVRVVDRALLTSGVLQCAALVGVALTGWISVGWVVGIWAVSSAVPLLLQLRAVRPRLPLFDGALARRALGLGVRYHAGSTALYLTYRLDVLALAAMTSARAVGLYTVAVTLAELTRIPTDALARACLAGQAVADLRSAAAATVRATRVSVALGLAAAGGLALAAPLLVPLGYGAAFRPALPAVYALAPGLLALGVTRQLGAYLIRLERPVVMSATSVAALAVNVGLILVLVPRWGIVGCGLAASISYGCLAVVHLVWFCRASGTPAARLLPDPVSALAAARAAAASLRRRNDAAAGADPLEDVLVAAQATAARGEMPKLEAAAGEEPEDLLRLGHLERVAADPVDEVVPAGHAAGAGSRPRGRGTAVPGAEPDGPDQRLQWTVPGEVDGAETDECRAQRRP
ncbi:hypothetical protein GCM10009827_112130 [Dactylosporangium maewongense]|uniref:Polysaccharide biosynthesis protein C-terminal domain-containing protein n=1 Tax=Dactylosporangium maewongense TaxID=634393 RepID=A0ABN2D710_9ACTN